MRLPIMLLCVITAGCATTGTDTLIPVAVPCIEKIPDSPKLITDPELSVLPDGAFVLALGADRLERMKYIAELLAVTVGCVK